MKRIVLPLFTMIALLLYTPLLYAGMNTIEGANGCAFNPFAYPTNADGEWGNYTVLGHEISVSKPQIGMWYTLLDDVRVDWGSWSYSQSFFKRLEFSYAYELIHNEVTNTSKHTVGTKYLILEENAFDTSFIPAISFGCQFKNTNNVKGSADSYSFDFYAVGSKMIKQLPLPLLLSGGFLWTRGHTNGVFGYDPGYDCVLLANAELFVLKNVIVGYEIKEGPNYGSWRDSHYMDGHLAWMPTNNVTVVAALVYTGNEKNTRKVGLGEGLVLSLQYTF
ncbi:DUF3034 family protein [bacterium]|nr:DUF3034 family protein [bacterium]MCP5461725.1 DUF3034 family protein [bacterium]